MTLKIYTKTGDDGTTSLFGGKRVPKDHERIEAYGTIDELNSWLGLLHAEINSVMPQSAPILRLIQEELFVMGSWLAAEKGKLLGLPEINSGLITGMEEAIDAMEAKLPVLKNFILPGGHPLIAQVHIARTVCRRAERRVVAINETLEHLGYFIEFLNRLSDYLFVLSRMMGKHLETAENIWQRKA